MALPLVVAALAGRSEVSLGGAIALCAGATLLFFTAPAILFGDADLSLTVELVGAIAWSAFLFAASLVVLTLVRALSRDTQHAGTGTPGDGE